MATNARERQDDRAAQEARLEALLRAQYGPESFEDFVGRIKPEYLPVPDHLRPLYELIERSRHEQVFALVSMPPRHGKTETIRLGLTYRTLYDPACQHAYASYTQDLSKEAGLSVRALSMGVGVRVGQVSELNTKAAGSATVLDWKTPLGGGLKSTSVGGGITGRGINGLLIIDDPIKGIQAASSLAERNRVWAWLKADILSRIEGGGSVIIIATRWHEDDPIGRITEGGPDWVAGLGRNWVHINLPAVGDSYGNPVDEREQAKIRADGGRIADDRVGRPLWPSVNSRYPNNQAAAMEWYSTCRAGGEYEWWSLYQGVPRSLDRKPFGVMPAYYQLPIRFQGRRAMLMLDPAATAKTASNYSALGCFTMLGHGDAVVEVPDRRGNLVKVPNPNPSTMDVVEIWKDKIPVPQVIDLAYEWQRGKYRGLSCGVECDGVSANLPDVVRRLQPKLKIDEVLTGGRDKLQRALAASKAWWGGRIRVPAPMDEDGNQIVIGWDVQEYLRVMKAFTGLGDQEDDVVDITAHAWNRMWRPFSSSGMTAVRAGGLY